MVKLPPGSAYFGTDRPENALPDEDPGMPPDLGPMPPAPPPGVAPAPGGPALGQASPGGYAEDPEIIAQMAEQYMGIPREQLDAMPPDQYMQLLDQLEQGYPQDEQLIGAITRIRPFLMTPDTLDPMSNPMPMAPEAGPMPPGGAPPSAEPGFRPDQPY